MPLRTTTPLLALLAFALLAAPQLHAQDARPSLNVGYYEFPPYIYTARDGHAAGSGARLVRLLLERAGYRPAFRALPSARLYLGLQDGSVALWAGAAKPELAADTLQARRVLGHVSLHLYYPAHQPLLDYQAPVEAASRQALASQELYRLPLRMIVSRHIPGAEALRDRLDQAYDQLRSDGADLSLL